ncbi:MAG: hypothetical protein IAG13_37540 [Deltaproteobacteria bacterium]|nr:hypothetical protein [Nannocystaceae bacterium]
MMYKRAAGGLLAIVLADAACFDSDQTVSRGATTGTTGEPTTSTTTVDATTGETTTGGSTGPFDTCRDAIDCVFQCVAMNQGQAEPDFSCILECSETLSVEEVKKLLELINCAGGVCRELGECASGDTTGESSSGGSSSSGSSSSGESSSSSSSSTGPTDPPLIDPCLGCVFTRIQDEESPGCEEFAMACPS